MKKSVLLLAIFFLCSCIPVSDWGDYWDKGIIDQNLVGTWLQEKFPGEDDANPTVKINVTVRKNIYQLDMFEENTKQEGPTSDREQATARILPIGKYSFLMVNTRAYRGLLRYKISKGIVIQYSVDDNALSAFITKNYPTEKNIKPCDRGCRGNLVMILSLNNKVFNILSQIPDSELYWHIVHTYHKIL